MNTICQQAPREGETKRYVLRANFFEDFFDQEPCETKPSHQQPEAPCEIAEPEFHIQEDLTTTDSEEAKFEVTVRKRQVKLD